MFQLARHRAGKAVFAQAVDDVPQTEVLAFQIMPTVTNDQCGHCPGGTSPDGSPN